MTHTVNLIDTNPAKETYHRLTLTQEGDVSHVTKTVNIIYTKLKQGSCTHRKPMLHKLEQGEYHTVNILYSNSVRRNTL